MEAVSVVGCALTPDLGRVTVRRLPNAPGIQATIFKHIAAGHIMVDDIMQIQSGPTVDVSFTVEPGDLGDIRAVVQRGLDELGSDAEVQIEVGLAKVSAVGVGMRSHTGVAAGMFKALQDAGVNIVNITTSEIKISCLVPKEDGPRALRSVHDAFELGSSGLSGQPAANAFTGPATG